MMHSTENTSKTHNDCDYTSKDTNICIRIKTNQCNNTGTDTMATGK